METDIKKKHKHLLVGVYKNGKWIRKCNYPDCDYEEETVQWKAWEENL